MSEQLAIAFSAEPSPGDRTRIGHHVMVWCWGPCGGWGWREEDLAALDLFPCDEPGCQRELGHDGPHNPRRAG